MDEILSPLLITAAVLMILVTITQGTVLVWTVLWYCRSKQTRQIIAKPPRQSKQSKLFFRTLDSIVNQKIQVLEVVVQFMGKEKFLEYLQYQCLLYQENLQLFPIFQGDNPLQFRENLLQYQLCQGSQLDL